MEPAVVSSEWVRSRIAEGTQASKVVDCSWFLVPPSSPHRPVLTGAAYFDVDDVADRSEDKSPSPHMLPSPDQFAAWMDRHNITPDDHVLLYDHSNGLLTASARVWWTFRVFGHGRVSVLEGGYASWPAGVEIPAQWRIVVASEAPSGAASYPASYHPELVWGQEDVLKHIVNADKKEDADVGRRHILLDARPAERFLGQADEPRRGVPSGSVPGSASFPFPQLFRKVERTNERGEVEATVHLLKSREELVELFAQRGVPIAPADKSGETVVAAMCGSGVTACPLALVLYTFGRPDVPIYDGSWTEWAFTAHPKQHLQQLPPDVVPLRKYHH